MHNFNHPAGSYEAAQPKAFDHTVLEKGKEGKADDMEALLQHDV